MKTLNSTTKTTKTSYSTPSIKVIELDNDALLYGINGSDGEEGGEWARQRNKFSDSFYWDLEEEEE